VGTARAALARVDAGRFCETGERQGFGVIVGRKWLVLGSIRDDHGSADTADPSRPGSDGLAEIKCGSEDGSGG
jgi:hypothetical protein